MSRDQDNIIDEAVVAIRPDLSGFRRKLERELKTQLAGVNVEIPVKLNESKNREALNYVAGLRTKYLKEQLNRTRNSNEKVQQAQDQARQHELKQERSFQETLDHLHLRANDVELNRTRSQSERLARVHDQANTAELAREKKLQAEREAELATGYKRIRNLAEEFERDRADAQIQEVRRTNTQIRSEAERAEKQRGDAIVEDHKRTNTRVRNADEAAARVVEQARQVENTRNLQRARNADEALTASHLRALDEMTRDEEKAAAERTKILKAEEKRRKESLAPFSKGQKLIDLGGEGLKPMSLLYGAVVAMTPALFAMGASAAQASTSIAALGAAGIGAALGIGAIGIAFNGIGDLLTLRKSVQNEATTKAANSARDAVTAADDLAQSKRNLADAQRDEKRANDDIHKARREAIRDLQDLRIAVRDLDNQYKSDQLTVAEKKRDALATDRNFFATALDRARAHQDVADAQTQLSDTALQRKRKKEDLRQSVSKGVEGSDKVRDAKERARDARDRTLDAQAALRKGAAGLGGGLDKTSSAAAQLNKKIKELAPAAREMYYWFLENEKLFKRLQKSIAQATLPGFNTFLKALTEKPKGGSSTLEIAARYAGELGAIIGKHVGEFGEFTQGPLFRGSMARIQKTNAAAFDKLGDALIKLADPITRILDKASPAFGAFADKVLELSTRFADFIEKADAKGDLADWFEKSRIEAKKWYDIAANIGTLLKNLFTAALPAGGSLVSSFEQFTRSLADWSGSASGQKQIKDFFTKVENLPYAKIIDFFKNAAIFFVAFRAFTLLKGINPIFALLGAVAAAHPKEFAEWFSKAADAIGRIIGYFAENPKATAGLLALIAVAKTGGALGFSLKLPAVTALQTALTSKFKFLDQFLGGGTKTGTMTVQAGVVNIYGAGTAAPGTDGSAGGAPTTGGAKPGRFAPGTVGNLGLSLGLGTGAALVGQMDTSKSSPFAQGVQAAVSGGLSGAALGTLVGGPIGTALGAAIGAAVGIGVQAWQARAEKMSTAAGKEAYALQAAQKIDFANPQLGLSISEAVKLPEIQKYIDLRKKSVAIAVDNERALNGESAARRLEVIENQASARTVQDLISMHTNDTIAAGKYSRAIFDVNGAIYRVNQELYNAKAAAKAAADGIEDVGKKAKNAEVDLGTLSDRFDSLSGTYKIILEIHGQEVIFATLEAAVAYQTAIKQGKEPNRGKLEQLQRQMSKQSDDPNLTDTHARQDVLKRAAGGIIRGYSPHDKADNIPAWLTADEYVQPVAAVKHYGTDFMEAVRTRRFPKFAAGGSVKQWPFPVKMPDPIKPVAQYLDTFGPSGGSDQEYTGRNPGGLGAVKGLGQRMMAAVIAIHQAFPWASVTSGFRPGAITVTGNKSYHGKRRATDWPASMELFNYFVKQYGNVAKEIIYSPAGRRQIWNGREHMYTGAVRATHFNHVHLALADGGLVPRKYDSGGILPPGYSLAFNGTGQNETIRTDQQEKALGATRLDRRDLALLAQFMAGAVGNPTIAMDGRKVAETTNRYNYLPSGVS